MDYGEKIIIFLELVAKLLKTGCKVAGLLIGFVALVFVLWCIAKALKEAAEK